MDGKNERDDRPVGRSALTIARPRCGSCGRGRGRCWDGGRSGNSANSPAFPDPTRGYALTNTPKHSGSLFTTYRFDFGLELGYGITYQGKFLLNQPNLTQLAAGTYVGYYVPSYTIHRFMANYPITENLTAQLNVQNFTNEKYVTTVRNNVNGSWAQPAPTRSAVLSLNYQF